MSGTIQLSLGNFVFDTKLDMDGSYKSLVGEQMGGTILDYRGADYAINVRRSDGSGLGYSQSIRELKVEIGSATGGGIEMTTPYNGLFERIWIRATPNNKYGLFVTDGVYCNFTDMTISGLATDGGARGVYIIGPDANNNILTRCNIGSCSIGIILQYTDGTTVETCALEQCDLGLWVAGGNAGEILNTWFEDNGDDDLLFGYLTNNTLGWTVRGCTYLGNGTCDYGIRISTAESQYITIANNHFVNHATAAILVSVGTQNGLFEFNNSFITEGTELSDASQRLHRIETDITIADTKAIQTGIANDDYVLFKAVDNDSNTLTEVARLTGAATPTFDLKIPRLTGYLDANALYIRSLTYLSGYTSTGQLRLHADQESNANIRIDDAGWSRIMTELQFAEVSEDAVGASIKVVKVTKAHDSDLFDASAVTDSATIWQQPANSVLLGAKMRLETQFAGITDLDVTLGLAGDPDGLVEKDAMDLVADTEDDEYHTRGAYWDEAAAMGFYFTDAAVDWIAYATSDVDDLDGTSAGSLDFYFTYLEL